MSKIYAVIGTSQQTIIADTVSYQPQVNEVLMKSERPNEGEYVANAEGEWVKPEPSIDEQLAELDSNYNTQKASISEQYTSAMMVDDTELASELKAELIALNEWYDEEYEKITGGAEV